MPLSQCLQGPGESDEEEEVPSDCDERLLLMNHPHQAGAGDEDDMDHALQASELQAFAKVRVRLSTRPREPIRFSMTRMWCTAASGAGESGLACVRLCPAVGWARNGEV